MAVFFWIFGFSSFTVTHLNRHDDESAKKLEDYIICNAEMKEHCDKDYPPPSWMIYLNQFNVASAGIYFVIVFGLQPRVIRHWGRVLRCLYRLDFQSLKNLTIKRTKGQVNVTVGSVQTQVSKKELLNAFEIE